MNRVEGGWRRSAGWLIRCTAALGLGILFLRWFERVQVYRPSDELFTQDPVPGHPPEDVVLTTSDRVRIHAWFFKSRSDECRNRRVICLFHGNAGNITHRGSVFAALLQTGVNLLTIDYRGYGRSEGRPSEEGTYRDAEAAYDWLIARGFKPSDIIVHGESLGGGIASHLATERPVGALVLQSTFTSIPDIGAELFPFLPVRTVGAIRYPTRDRLPRIRVPVLVMHSRGDEIVPFRHGERNFAAVPGPKTFWELQGGHNDAVHTDEANFVAGLEQFLSRHFPCAEEGNLSQ